MKPSRDDPTAVGTTTSRTRSSRSWEVNREAQGHRCWRRQRRRDLRAGLARRDRDGLVDIKEGLPQGKALDISQAAAVPARANVTGSNGYTSRQGPGRRDHGGSPRQPGMSRDDLVTTNEKIVKSVTRR
jgi:hypothetical protein